MAAGMERGELLALVGVGLAALAVIAGPRLADDGAVARGDPAAAEAAGPGIPADRSPTVVLVVLDTVRADHVSACGASAWSTPTLSELVVEGAALSCDTIAPGSWTLPSHASFFTGQPIEAHGAHFVPRDKNNLLGAMQVRPLEGARTLAERFKAQGYRTVALSGNPVVSKSTGLVRGFDWWRSARRFGKLYGDDYLGALEQALDTQAPVDQPLFVFLNIADAHQPWSAVPRSAEGLTAQRAMHPRMEAVFQGKLTGEALDAHFEKTRQAYAYGVHRADATLGRALDALEARGWAETGMRIVVVSDHGEFLGEHGLVDHGRYLWEENQRVFLLHGWRGPDAPRLDPLSRDLSGRHAYDLALAGRLPGARGPVTSVAFPDAYWQKLSDGRFGGSLSAAVWSGDEKLLWQDGQITRFDLRVGEAAGEPAGPEHPLRATLNGLVSRAKASAGAPTTYDPALLEQLQAAGYMDEGGDDEGDEGGLDKPGH
jgi:hypothetical protein